MNSKGSNKNIHQGLLRVGGVFESSEWWVEAREGKGVMYFERNEEVHKELDCHEL